MPLRLLLIPITSSAADLGTSPYFPLEKGALGGVSVIIGHPKPTR